MYTTDQSFEVVFLNLSGGRKLFSSSQTRPSSVLLILITRELTASSLVLFTLETRQMHKLNYSNIIHLILVKVELAPGWKADPGVSKVVLATLAAIGVGA